MLEHIISSPARLKILTFFCLNSQGKFFVRELTRKLSLQLNSARRELTNLEKLGFLRSEDKAGKKYYYADENFILFQEIKNLIFKSKTLEQMNIAHRISSLPGLKLLVYTGVLTKSPAMTDVLIVGKVNKAEIDKQLKKIADGLADGLRYSILPVNEYNYRISVGDRFIYNIWSNPHLVVVDKLGKLSGQSDYQFKHFREDEQE